METILLYLVKVSVSIVAFFLLYLALFQKKKLFRFNRLFLLGSMIISFFIPFVTFQVDVPPVAVSTSYAETTPNIAISASASRWPADVDWKMISFYTVIAGMVVFLLNLLVSSLKAWSIIRKGEKQRFRGISYRVSCDNVHPFSFFNHIVVPSEVTGKDYLPIILEHEYIHVKERHTIDVLIAELLFLLQWFNPFAWLMKHAIKNNLEYLTDDLIIRKADQQTYQLAMVSLAGKSGIAPFLTALNGSQLKNRIIMMKQKANNQKQILRKLAVIPLLTILIATLSNKEFRAAPVQQEKTVVIGQVLDENTGKTMSGVAVLTKGEPTGTITDRNGNYELAISNPETVLIFSYPGHDVKELPVAGKKVINVSLKKSDKSFGIKEPDKKMLKVLPGNIEISGKVTDENGRPIAAVAVIIKGKPIGTITDQQGNYLLKVSEEDDKLVFSMKNYETEEVVIEEKTRINVDLKKKKEGPASDEKVGLKNNWGSKTPLFIIDGREVESIDHIHPADIESITVLKDASAKVQYGKKGENGVVLVSLKKTEEKKSLENQTNTGDSLKKDSVETVFVLDGKEVSHKSNPTGRIDSVETFYGHHAEGDVKQKVFLRAQNTRKGPSKPLFIIDGKNMGKSSVKDLGLDTTKFESINVIKEAWL